MRHSLILWFLALSVYGAGAIVITPGSVGDTPIHTSTNGYSGFLVRVPVNSLNLWLYDTGTGNNVSVIPLTSGMETNVGQVPDFGFVGDRVIVAGASPFDISTQRPSVYEYQLSGGGTIPTIATLITNFNTGTNNCLRVNVVSMTNATIAVSFALHTTNSLVNLTYRFSDGTWTNYPSFALLGTNLSPTFQCAAQMPGSGALWVFLNKDSSGWLSAGEFLTRSNGTDGLFLNRRMFVADKNSGRMAPYGEICLAKAISGGSTNCIFLAYNNRDVVHYTPNPYSWLTTAAIMGLNDSGTKYLLGLSTSQITRMASTTICETNNSLTLGYISPPAGIETLTGIFPSKYDTFNETSGALLSSHYGPNSYYSYYITGNEKTTDYILRFPDLSWNLVINPSSPIEPGNFRIFGRESIHGNVIIR